MIPSACAVSTQPTIRYFDSIIQSVGSKTMLFQPPADLYIPRNGQYCENWVMVDYFNDDLKRNFLAGLDEYQQNQIIMDSFVTSDTFHNSAEEFAEIKLVFDQLAKKINCPGIL